MFPLHIDEHAEYGRLYGALQDMSEKARMRRRQINGLEAMVAREKEQLDSDRREIERLRKVADRLKVRVARSKEVTK